MRIVLIFIDGIGIGSYDEKQNPCTYERLVLFNNFHNRKRSERIPYNGQAKPIDVQLGVKGIPQSATGQTALLTGVNAAHLLNAHLSAFPNKSLRDVIEKESIFKKLIDKQKKVAFINAYRPPFFEKDCTELLPYLSVTTVATWKAGLRFFTLEDVKARHALYHDFTNMDLIQKGFELPYFCPATAGRILSQISQKYDFSLYEYFLTDHVGHSQDMTLAKSILFDLECFILSFLETFDLTENLVLITSDHGNIEDLSLRTHSCNWVPLLAWGRGSKQLMSDIHSIQDVTKNIVSRIN